MIFCIHDLASGKHDFDSLKKFNKPDSSNGVNELANARTICLIMDCEVSFESNFFNLLEESFRDQDLALLYTDFEYESEITSVRSRVSPPNWSPERFLSNDFLGPVLAVDFGMVQSSVKLEQSTRTALILTCLAEKLKVQLVEHVGYVISPKNLNLVTDARNSEITQFLVDHRPHAKVLSSNTPWTLISNAGLAPKKISIVIPTRGSKKNILGPVLITECIKSLLDQNFGNSTVEVILVFDTDVNLNYLTTLKNINKSGLELKFVEYAPPFNFSKKCNLGAGSASGEVVIFLNDDTIWSSPNSLLEIAGSAMLEGVGAVGAKLFFENYRIQHAGHILREGFIDHAYFKDVDGFGPFGDLVVTHEVVGVTGACLAQRKSVWESIGKWDESFPASYNDVDYCFRIRELGMSILQVNQAKLIHFESLTRNPKVRPEEIEMILKRWDQSFIDDPFFRMAGHLPVIPESTVKRYWLYAKRIYRHEGLVGVLGLFANVFRKMLRIK
jgi:GT2 family glycosyltransferase